MKKPEPFQIASALFQNHVDDCRQCSLAKFTGKYCDEGRRLMEDISQFFKQVEAA